MPNVFRWRWRPLSAAQAAGTHCVPSGFSVGTTTHCHFRRRFSDPYYPVIDLSSGGSVDGLIYTFDQIPARINPDTRGIPGHSSLVTRAELAAYREMLVSVRDRVRALIEAGKSMDEVVAGAQTRDFDAK